MDFIFYFSIAFLAYTYFIYPLFIGGLAKYFGRKMVKTLPDELPSISVVICIYNAEKLIEQRLNNILAQDYPKDKIEIIIVADGCKDGSVELINSLNLANVKLVSYENNKGKSYALAKGIAQASHELLLFADVRQRFEPDVIKQLLPYFADESVAAVTGNLLIEESKGDPGLYWRYEKAIRKCEHHYKSLLGVTGAIYMARKSLMPAFPADVVLDDMYGPLSMVKQGYRIAYSEQAIAYDNGSHTLREEFDRKVRTLAGNYQLFKLLPWLLVPIKNPVFFELISHKVCRLLVPYFLILLFISSAFVGHWFAGLSFIGQCAFYGYALFHYLHSYKKHHKSNFVLSFVMLNLAALKAGVVYWLSPTSRLWKSH
ncbi:glycosyltransferase family 2 protein [Thalassotalea sp. PLHSN55]|uniref:glycosyltransferase family 2 protein n=1 Tax=Thalassotalea sp. PLHSN55 TaxID=3435888 RepID=UPI003F83581B